MNYEGWFEELSRSVKRKSLMFLVGDFVGDFNLSILAKKHDLVVIIIRDHFIERDPKPLGDVRLVDPGYLDSFSGNIDENTVKIYQDSLKSNDMRLFKHLRKLGLVLLRYIHTKSISPTCKEVIMTALKDVTRFIEINDFSFFY